MNGARVRVRPSAISSRSSAGASIAVGNEPRPPASQTATHSSAPCDPATSGAERSVVAWARRAPGTLPLIDCAVCGRSSAAPHKAACETCQIDVVRNVQRRACAPPCVFRLRTAVDAKRKSLFAPCPQPDSLSICDVDGRESETPTFRARPQNFSYSATVETALPLSAIQLSRTHAQKGRASTMLVAVAVGTILVAAPPCTLSFSDGETVVDWWSIGCRRRSVHAARRPN